MIDTQQDSLRPQIPFAYDEESKVLTQLTQDHAHEVERVRLRREVRRHRVNVQELRDSNKIRQDETVIPDRTIDRNIRAERPPTVRYVETSTTVLSFFDLAHRDANFEALDNWTTALFRQPGWKKDIIKMVDSRALHGAGYLELIYDKSKPGRAVYEYVRREDLIIPKGTRDIQTAARVGRVYELTKQGLLKLSQTVKFDRSLLQPILEHYAQKTEAIKVVKWFMRDDNNNLYVAWRTYDGDILQSWLKDPAPFVSGILEIAPAPPTLLGQPAVPQIINKPSTKLRIYTFLYDLQEDEEILDIPGRAALDEPTQEALTSSVSATVNATVRASGFYVHEKPDGTGNYSSKEGVEIAHNKLVRGNLDLFQPAFPNAIALSVAQMLRVTKAQETGNVDFAAMERQDTAKTATELRFAQQEAETLSSTSISILSDSFLEMYLDWWEIIKSHVNVGDIQVPPSFQELNIDINSPTLTATMAADARVVKQAQEVEKLLRHYPMTVGTPYQEVVFMEIMRTLFPDKVARWVTEAQKNDAKVQLLQKTLQMFESLPPQLAANLPPQLQSAIAEIGTGISQLFNAKPGNAK